MDTRHLRSVYTIQPAGTCVHCTRHSLQTNLFGICRFYFDLPLTGTVVPEFTCRTVRLLANPLFNFTGLLEIAFVAFVLMFTCRQGEN
jgi:hypothetical protein